MSVKRVISQLLLPLLLFGGICGCDSVSPVETDTQGTPPLVSDLRLRPDSIHVDELPPDRVQDSVAQLDLAVQAEVEDPDGTVERVVFTIEPASDPRSTATGRLEPVADSIYGRAFLFGVPTSRDELYTIRVFAVDNDSLASNQAIGQIQFVSD